MNNNIKQTFIAVVVIMGFLLGWDHFVIKRYAPPAPAPESAQGTLDASPAAQAEKTPTPSSQIETPQPASTIQTVSLQSNNIDAELTTMGAGVQKWNIRENGHWVDLKYENFEEEKWPNPLATFPKLNFSVQKISDSEALFSATHPSGMVVEKRVVLGIEPFISRIEMTFKNASAVPLDLETQIGWGPGIGKKILGQEKEEEEEKKEAQRAGPEIRGAALASKVKTWKTGFFTKTLDKTDKDSFQWAGVDNNHFISAFLAPEGDSFKEVHIEADKKMPPVVSLPLQPELNPGETVTFEFDLFTGPKKIALLEEIGRGLPKSIDFGFFGVISKFLLHALLFFYSMTGNFGWAIMILTVCYQLIVLPLTKKSMENTVRMKEIQPQLKKIQAQFKSDPKRLQMETFSLYRKHGMKFMGMEGCFPLLIQMPFFFAIYRTLAVAYPLRDAPWILWIKDLSSPDPLFILPILMGLVTFLQQKFSTATVDPAQQKMMLIMPVFLVVIFINMPAGLVLYWTTQSLVTVIIQKILQAKYHPQSSS